MGKTNLASNLGENLIINPTFDIWQRGATFPAIASSTYTADRFAYFKNGTMVHTIGQSSQIPDSESVMSAYIECTTDQPALGVGDFSIYQQIIEGYNLRKIAGKPFVLSFWVKATKTGIYSVAFRNTANDRTYIAEYEILASEVWEQKFILVTHDETGTWDYSNGAGMRVSWCLGAGSNFQVAEGSWQGGNYLASPNQVNSMDSIGNFFRIAKIQLHEGVDAHPFKDIARDLGKELELCQRYYEKSYDLDVAPGSNIGIATTQNAYRAKGTSSGEVPGMMSFATRKRAAAVNKVYSPDGTVDAVWDVVGSTSRVVIYYCETEAGFAFSTNTTLINGSNYYWDWTSDAEL